METNEQFSARLMAYHDHKMEIRACRPNAVVEAFHDAGKIEGYLDALVDLKIITEKEKEKLYCKYTNRHI